ncbi:hypothetical protein CC80DRAFT_544502 [Byssothecium circinans]|uniref:Uncharacterized protein n=1 Tax=Byssothecium circinans TaxID=147558 RepID=A0A6A5UG19_9PLEO|nr:hypothetical protein CC80DRAFT_544502 [Byssothecium circinans]
MRWSLPLVSLFFLNTAAFVYDFPLNCAGRKAANNKECQEPLPDAVTAVLPGKFYVARLPCLDCPAVETAGENEGRKSENELFFNISLSHDKRTLYLNDQPILPTFTTIPTPQRIAASQIAPDFTRADLDTTIECALEICADKPCSCLNSSRPDTDWYFGKANLDFDFSSHWLSTDSATQREKWEVTFDVIGGWDNLAGDKVWKANHTKQQMLRILVEGEEIDGEIYPGEKNRQGGGSLFEENPATEETQYEYTITSVGLTKRTYTFPITPQALGFWSGLRRFFGLDVVRTDGHVVYLQEEWARYGKKGSLRNHMGVIVNDWPWTGIFATLGSVVGGIVALYLASKLFTIVKQQRELARWDGMDTVWANMRRDSEARDEDEEGDGLLSREERYRDSVGEGSYRDDVDDAGSGPPRYTDDVQTNKPLPSKPLPEKPLPAVPLIDA